MASEVFITYNDKKQIERLGDFNMESPIFHLLDTGSLTSQKAAKALKNHWAAKKDPFVIIFEDAKPKKAFYSETGEDVIDQLIKYLKR